MESDWPTTFTFDNYTQQQQCHGKVLGNRNICRVNRKAFLAMGGGGEFYKILLLKTHSH